jgi:hypothetical protein
LFEVFQRYHSGKNIFLRVKAQYLSKIDIKYVCRVLYCCAQYSYNKTIGFRVLSKDQSGLCQGAMMELNKLRSLQKNNGSHAGPFLALRYRREPEKRNGNTVFPFTELPDDVQLERFSPLSAVRKVINFLLLFLLGLALLGLVFAFAYQLVNQPYVLGQWGIQLIQSVQKFVETLLAQF